MLQQVVIKLIVRFGLGTSYDLVIVKKTLALFASAYCACVLKQNKNFGSHAPIACRRSHGRGEIWNNENKWVRGGTASRAVASPAQCQCARSEKLNFWGRE